MDSVRESFVGWFAVIRAVDPDVVRDVDRAVVRDVISGVGLRRGPACFLLCVLAILLKL